MLPGPEGDPLCLAGHDEGWGVPSRDDRHLFELPVLERARAGLSWATILHAREGYRRAARYGQLPSASVTSTVAVADPFLPLASTLALTE